MSLLNIQIHVDGACRNNGRAKEIGIGVVIEDGITENRHISLKLVGRTNNEAEYMSLITALENVLRIYGDANLKIHSDSLLVVNQIKGIYAAKNERLKILHKRSLELLKLFNSWDMIHVYREFNRQADALANLALDN